MLKVFLVDFITRFGENAIRICGRCAYSVHVQYRKALPWRGVLLGGVQSAIVAGCASSRVILVLIVAVESVRSSDVRR